MLTFFATDAAVNCNKPIQIQYRDDAIVEFTEKCYSTAIYAKEDKIYIEVHLRNRSYDFGNISGPLVYKTDNIDEAVNAFNDGDKGNKAEIALAVLGLVKYSQVYELVDDNKIEEDLKSLDQETTGILLDVVNDKLDVSVVKGIYRPQLQQYVGPGFNSVGRFYKINSEIDENGFIILYNSFYGYVGPTVETLIIPEGVEYVRTGALCNGNMDAVKEVVFPKSLKEVESGANRIVVDWSKGIYKYPEKLEKLVFLGNVDKIDEGAFSYGEDTSRLKEVIFGGKVKSIEESAFDGVAFERIEFPYGVDKIKYAAFRNCKFLKQVEIPKGKRIWRCAFWGCSALEKVIISEKCKIDENAFYRCESLANEEGEIYVNGVWSRKRPIEETL